MTEKVQKTCQCGCGVPLVGRQLKFSSEECRKKNARENWIGKTYDLSLEDYDTILAFQGGKCAICRRPPKPGKSLAVDHHHETGQVGKVRGLLCFLCNKRFLGARSDGIIIAMYNYVTNPPATAALGREVIAPGRPKKPRKPRPRRGSSSAVSATRRKNPTKGN